MKTSPLSIDEAAAARVQRVKDGMDDMASLFHDGEWSARDLAAEVALELAAAVRKGVHDEALAELAGYAAEVLQNALDDKA